MNNQIINNLYQFWEHIGKLNNRLIEAENYSAVSIENSDWPNRIFNIQYDNDIIEKIQELSIADKLPEMLTLSEPNHLNEKSGFDFVLRQKNMALDLTSFSMNPTKNPKIKRVRTKNDSINFAHTASESFSYIVDPEVIFKIVKSSTTIRMFTYQEDTECLGCGIVFFDRNNNAGLHMIGTLPKDRGKGIGKSMTENLLMEAKENNAKTCVLHASAMGEKIYTKLGFKTFGEIETYKILKNKNY